MDKSKLRSGLLDLIRDHLPKFERAARVTCMLSVRLDGCDEAAVFVDIAEELPATAVAAAAAAATRQQPEPKTSKRKSQAPQKMVADGADSFVPAATAASPAATSGSLGGRSASSSFLNGSSAVTLEQAVNLSTGGRDGFDSAGFHPATTQQLRQTSTPMKEAVGLGFYVNNPSFQRHFLLPHGAGILAASVFPSPTAVFQSAVVPAMPSTTSAAAAAAATDEEDDEDRKPNAEALPKLPILPAGGCGEVAGQNPQPHQLPQQQQQRSRSLFGLRPRRGNHKSFPCNQCQETFGSLAALSKHTYTTHKSYKCTFCSANFTQRSNLQRHSLKHVGFKPFACKCCQKSYYRKDHLVRHIEVTHPGKEPKKNIETKLSSAECLEYLERKYESGDYSIALDADADEDMPDEEADGQAGPRDGDEEMPDPEAEGSEDDEAECEEGEDEEQEHDEEAKGEEEAVKDKKQKVQQRRRRQPQRPEASSDHRATRLQVEKATS